jgi:hypothetical protein
MLRFEVLTAITSSSTIFWNIIPCSPVEDISDESTASIFRARKATNRHNYTYFLLVAKI